MSKNTADPEQRTKNDTRNSKRFTEAIIRAFEILNAESSPGGDHSAGEVASMKDGMTSSDLAFIFGVKQGEPRRPWLTVIRRQLVMEGCIDEKLMDYLSGLARHSQELWNRCNALVRRGIIRPNKSGLRRDQSRLNIHYVISEDESRVQRKQLRTVINKLRAYGDDDTELRGAVTVVGLSDLERSGIDKATQTRLIEQAEMIVSDFHDAWEKANEISEEDHLRMRFEQGLGDGRPISSLNKRHLAFPIIVIDPNDSSVISEKEFQEHGRVWKLKQEVMDKPSDSE